MILENSRKIQLSATIEFAGKEHIVILVHGYTDHKDRGGKYLAKALAAKGISSIRFDLTGHGASGGDIERANVSDFIDDIHRVYKWCKEQNFTRISLLGHSLGGLACIHAAMQIPLYKLLLLAPTLHPEQTWKRRFDIEEWKKTGWLDYTLLGKLKHKLHYSVYEDIQKLSATIDTSKISAETLVLHGDADDLVPLSSSQELVETWENSSLIVLEGANHWLAIDGDYSQSNKIIGDWFS